MSTTTDLIDGQIAAYRARNLERVFYLASAPSATTGTIKSWPFQVT